MIFLLVELFFWKFKRTYTSNKKYFKELVFIILKPIKHKRVPLYDIFCEVKDIDFPFSFQTKYRLVLKIWIKMEIFLSNLVFFSNLFVFYDQNQEFYLKLLYHNIINTVLIYFECNFWYISF